MDVVNEVNGVLSGLGPLDGFSAPRIGVPSRKPTFDAAQVSAKLTQNMASMLELVEQTSTIALSIMMNNRK